jgi:hypothetical protein
MKWREMLNADCSKRDGRLNDRCDLVCPDLSKALLKRTEVALGVSGSRGRLRNVAGWDHGL